MLKERGTSKETKHAKYHPVLTWHYVLQPPCHGLLTTIHTIEGALTVGDFLNVAFPRTLPKRQGVPWRTTAATGLDHY